MRTQKELMKRFNGVFTNEQSAVLSEAISEAYDKLVKTSDFNELKEIVRGVGISLGELAAAQAETKKELRELAEAQRKSEGRLTRLEETVQELATAQKETQKEVRELAEAQRKSEGRLTRLEETVQALAVSHEETRKELRELAIAVKETQKEVRELAIAVKETQKEVRELAIAVKETQRGLQELVLEHKKTRSQLGGLSMTVGYRLEDEAYKALPELLKRDRGIHVKSRLKRQFVSDNKGIKIEVNIIGEAEQNGKKLTLVGEAKSQLSKNGVDDFISKKINKLEGVLQNIFPVLVTYMISEPDAEEYAKEKGIALYYSYDFL